ncbi:hypothetical protein KIN20_020265, partial [Parelaphostrongylus tenuis]
MYTIYTPTCDIYSYVYVYRENNIPTALVMDDPSQKGRRSSILELRQGDVAVENTDDVDDEQKQVFERRVSFHNVKTVQTFDENHLNLLDGSPVKEKIQETMSSDGVLT